MNDRDIAKQLKRFEFRLAERNRKEFSKMFHEFKRIIEKDNSNFGISDVKINYEKFKELAKKYMFDVFAYNVKSTLKMYSKIFDWNIPKNKISGIRDEIINEYNRKYGAGKVLRITETTRKILNNVIVKAQDEGLSLGAIVKEITSSVENMSIYRAKTIARTETSSAINNTSLKTAKAAKMKNKKWIHIGGRYTSRENHKKLNNKIIGIDELFDLGNGIKAMCPHDPDLPVGEIVNCNCIIIFK